MPASSKNLIRDSFSGGRGNGIFDFLQVVGLENHRA
jgi:hypothetical protein